jgi:hypothetical protein
MADLVPEIIYQFSGTDPPLRALGYLLQGENGQVWCQPGTETAKAHLGHVAAFRIDPSLLQELPRSPEGRQRYLYLGEGPIYRQGSSMPHPIKGDFQ